MMARKMKDTDSEDEIRVSRWIADNIVQFKGLRLVRRRLRSLTATIMGSSQPPSFATS